MKNILLIPAQGCTLGLTLWYTSVLPSLLPFLILSGLLIRTGLFRWLNRLFSPVLTRLFPVSSEGSYVILMGYLCGFPMGAKVIADLIQEQQISREEGAYLLSFCNHVNPAFFINYICVSCLGYSQIPWMLFCLFYGIPLLYGILYGRLFYRSSDDHPTCRFPASDSKSMIDTAGRKKQTSLHRIDFPMLDVCIMDSFATITKIGGYMILFTILTQMLTILSLPDTLTAAAAAVLEISSGTHALSILSLSSPCKTALVCAAASFGGLCTCAQISSVLSDTDLNLRPWITGRILLPLLTFLLVLLLPSLVPALHGYC